MFVRTTLLMTASVLSLAAVCAPAAAQHSHRERHAHANANANANANASPQLVLDKGAKWTTDEALRTGMLRIRAAVERNAEPNHTIDPARAPELSAEVQAGVAYMVEHCKLAPAADAVLHLLIADMLKGADLMAHPQRAAEGLALVHGALERYPVYFRHAGWH